MLFGRKPEPEKVKEEELRKFLNQTFDKKLGKFSSNAASIVKQLPALKKDFIRDCDEFEGVDAEPYTEYTWNPNINAIKSQKTAYVDVLRNLTSKFTSESEAPNAYFRYKMIMLNIDELLNNILKYNSHYKTVLYCYPGHLRGFKKTFSSIEQLRNALKTELASRENDYTSYNEISDMISKLNSATQEIGMLKGNLSTLEENKKSLHESNIDKELSEFESKLSAKQQELSNAKAKLSSLRDSIRIQTAPLDRASRKFDHISKRKRKLNYFVTNPIEAISSEEEYAEFLELLNELKTCITPNAPDEKSLDITNKAETLDIISKITSLDLYRKILSLEPFDSEVRNIISEIKELERTIYSIRAIKDGKLKSAGEIERINREITNLQNSKVHTKAEIARLFAESYSKQILVTE